MLRIKMLVADGNKKESALSQSLLQASSFNFVSFLFPYPISYSLLLA
jgi:hypothetical protein